MAYKHTITPHDKWFLEKHMKDPVAQEPFKIGDTIVICAKCKTAHYDSSWSLNANKCCSMGCNHSDRLKFNKFSPSIFQPKRSRNTQFKVIIKKLSFVEKLKLFDYYLMVNTISILIPIFVFMLMIYTVQYQAVSTFNAANLFEASQDELVDMVVDRFSKFDKVVKKPKSIDIDFGEMSYKLIMVSLSFDEIKSKLKSTEVIDALENSEISDKLNNTGSNIGNTARQAGEKIVQLIDLIAEYIGGVLE